MEKKEELYISKYRQAEQIRKLKESWRQRSIEDKYREQIKELLAGQKLAELEKDIKIAWKFKEGKKMINDKKKEFDERIYSEMLRMKVCQDLKRQQRKIKRSVSPKRKKVNPLPYLRAREEENDWDTDSEEIVEVAIPKHHIRSNLLNKTPAPNPLGKLKYKIRYQSPDIRQVFFSKNIQLS